MTGVAQWFKKQSLSGRKMAMRLAGVFFLVNTIMVWRGGTPYDDPAFAASVNIGIWAALYIAGLLFFCVLFSFAKSETPDRLFLVVTCFVFLVSILFKAKDAWLFAICCALFAGVAAWGLGLSFLRKAENSLLDSDGPRFLRSPRVSRSVSIGIYAALFAAFAAFVGGLTALRYEMYISPNFDFGIFSQMFEYMKETGIPYTTCERDGLLSHFQVHLSFIYYLIFPFYVLFHTPLTLNIAQAVILATGLYPLWLLCKKHRLSDSLTVLLGIAYIFYPALSAGCFYDIHENCFLTPLLLCLLLAIDQDNTIALILSAVMVCAVKEDAPIYLIFIAIWMAFAKKKIVKPLLLLVFSVGYFLLAVWYLDSHGDGAMLYRYANFSTDGGSLTDIVKACLVNPGYVFSQCLDEDKMVFFLQMMLPLGFLPLFCTRISSYILLGPFMLINLMSYYPYQHSLDYQYNFGVTALLFYLTIVNLSARKQQTRRFLALLCAAFAVFGFSAFVGERLGYISYYQNTKEVCDTLDEVVAQVPKDASVYSSTFLLPHLYQNKILYQLNADSPDLSGRTEYVLIDLRFQEFSDLYPLYVQAGFQTVVYEEGAAALLYCPFYEAAEP